MFGDNLSLFRFPTSPAHSAVKEAPTLAFVRAQHPMFTWLRNWLGGVVGTQDWDANEIGDLTGFVRRRAGLS